MIKKPTNWEQLEENEVVSGGVDKGIYFVKFLSVKDVVEKEYLEIKFDIVKDAKYEKFFSNLSNNNLDNWSNQGIIRQSYKESSSRFFKAFITAVQKSNQSYIWDWNEQSLVGKYAVVVMSEEEYLDKDGNLKLSCKPTSVRSIQAKQKGEIEIPEIKRLKVSQNIQQQVVNDPFANLKLNPQSQISDDDLPF